MSLVNCQLLIVMKRHKHKAKKILKYISNTALHIWVIIVLANVLLIYTFHFYLHAATDSTKIAQTTEQANPPAETSSEDDAAIPTIPPEPTDEVPAIPAGPLLGLSFSVPGIGSNGGNLKPIHPTRNVTIYLYKTGVNALDKKIRPVNTIKTKAYFDANPDSPTYTQFLNPKIDLGAAVNDGDYQIMLQTDFSFRTLVKEKPDSVGGIEYSLFRQTIQNDDYNKLPIQTLLVGDLYPVEGPDNVADLGDYDVLVNCYHLRHGTPKCPNPYMADLNDDGIVNGLDYNVLVTTFKSLKEQGFSVPELIIPPTEKKVTRLSHLTPAATKKPEPTPTKVPENTSSAGGGIAGVLILLILLVVLGGIGFFLYLKNPKLRGTVDALMHRSPIGPSPTAASQPQPNAQQPSQPSPAAPAPQPQPEPAQPASTAGVQPPPAAPSAEAASTSNPNPSTSSGPTPTAPTGDAKEYYVKKQSDDETKTGFWLTLTDDNGPTLAHYKGTAVTDGFAHVKGDMKTENGKTFMEISELTPEA